MVGSKAIEIEKIHFSRKKKNEWEKKKYEQNWNFHDIFFHFDFSMFQHVNLWIYIHSVVENSSNKSRIKRFHEKCPKWFTKCQVKSCSNWQMKHMIHQIWSRNRFSNNFLWNSYFFHFFNHSMTSRSNRDWVISERERKGKHWLKLQMNKEKKIRNDSIWVIRDHKNETFRCQTHFIIVKQKSRE